MTVDPPASTPAPGEGAPTDPAGVSPDWVTAAFMEAAMAAQQPLTQLIDVLATVEEGRRTSRDDVETALWGRGGGEHLLLHLGLEYGEAC